MLGFGLDLNIADLTVLTPIVVEKRDQGQSNLRDHIQRQDGQNIRTVVAVVMGAITQFRIMGGAIGLGVATNILNVYVRSHLAGSVTPTLVTRLLQSTEEIESLDPASQAVVRAIFGHGYNLQMKAMIGFAAAQVPASLLVWGNHIKGTG